MQIYEKCKKGVKAGRTSAPCPVVDAELAFGESDLFFSSQLILDPFHDEV